MDAKRQFFCLQDFQSLEGKRIPNRVLHATKLSSEYDGIMDTNLRGSGHFVKMSLSYIQDICIFLHMCHI